MCDATVTMLKKMTDSHVDICWGNTIRDGLAYTEMDERRQKNSRVKVTIADRALNFLLRRHWRGIGRPAKQYTLKMRYRLVRSGKQETEIPREIDAVNEKRDAKSVAAFGECGACAGLHKSRSSTFIQEQIRELEQRQQTENLSLPRRKDSSKISQHSESLCLAKPVWTVCMPKIRNVGNAQRNTGPFG